MPRRFASIVVLLTAAAGVARSTETSPSSVESTKRFLGLRERERAIHDALVEIADGKIATDNDDRLIVLIEEGIVDAATRAADPSGAIEAAANQARDFVTDATNAYSSAIFRAAGSAEARRIFERFQNTVRRIVYFARGGRFVDV